MRRSVKSSSTNQPINQSINQSFFHFSGRLSIKRKMLALESAGLCHIVIIHLSIQSINQSIKQSINHSFISVENLVFNGKCWRVEAPVSVKLSSPRRWNSSKYLCKMPAARVRSQRNCRLYTHIIPLYLSQLRFSCIVNYLFLSYIVHVVATCSMFLLLRLLFFLAVACL